MTPFLQDLNELLVEGEDLPTLPDVVFELHAALDNEMASDAVIADVVSRDPALTARLLRVANSAFYNRGDEIGSVLGAVQRLGVRQVRAVCLVLAVVQSFSRRDGGLSHREFWDHSAVVGRLAQRIGDCTPAAGTVGRDDLYVAGLLHDVGLLVLDQFFHDRFQEILGVHEVSGQPLHESEELVLGMDHGEIGGLLLGRWSLPQATIDCVAGHHRPEGAPEAHRGACRVVHAAEITASALGMAVGLEGLRDANAPETLSALGMDQATAETLLEEGAEIAEAARGLLAA